MAVMGNLMNGNNCTMLQLGLNSPIIADASNRPPLNLTVVVDVSGSMLAEGKLDFVRDGLDLTVDGMRDGNFYFLEDSGAVSEVFTEELSYFTVPVALNLEVTLTAGNDYDFGAAYGSPFWEDTDTGGSLSVPSVFLAHRESADDITDDGGRRGGGSAPLIELMPKAVEDDGSGATETTVATVDIAFDDPIAGQRVTDQVVVDYPHAPWEMETAGYFRSDNLAVVQKSFVMLNLYVGIEQACRMFHDFGETTENVQMLLRLLAAVEDYNEEVGDADIGYDIDLVEQLISVIQRFGAPVEAPSIPADPWPAD